MAKKSPSSDDGDLVLDGDEPVSDLAKIRRLRSEKYELKISDYCRIYGRPQEDGSRKPIDRKTVERWIRRGREAEDLPPLDSPELMAAWRRRNYEGKVPEVFISYEEGEKGGPAVPEVGEAGAVTEQEKVAREALAKAMELAEAEGLGFEASLERARLAERLAYFQYQVVLLEPEKFAPAVETRRKKSWEEASQVLLRAEEKAEKIMDQSSEWVRWDEAEKVYAEKLGTLGRGVRSLFTRVAAKATLPAGSFARLEKAFQGEVDSLFGVLGDGGFEPLLELES